MVTTSIMIIHVMFFGSFKFILEIDGSYTDSQESSQIVAVTNLVGMFVRKFMFVVSDLTCQANDDIATHLP